VAAAAAVAGRRKPLSDRPRAGLLSRARPSRPPPICLRPGTVRTGEVSGCARLSRAASAAAAATVPPPQCRKDHPGHVEYRGPCWALGHAGACSGGGGRASSGCVPTRRLPCPFWWLCCCQLSSPSDSVRGCQCICLQTRSWQHDRSVHLPPRGERLSA
jgi:hypothetical protein